MGMRSPWATFQPSLRFALLFIANLLIFSQLFNWLHDFFVDVYMYPVALTSAELLNALGVAVELDSSMLPRGFCDFLLNGAIYRIIHECTGIFALLVLVALILAYPTSPLAKIQGILIGLPAFYLYSTIRLVVIGLVADASPQWVELTHSYLMVLVNLGFSLFIWIYWLEEATNRA